MVGGGGGGGGARVNRTDGLGAAGLLGLLVLLGCGSGAPSGSRAGKASRSSLPEAPPAAEASPVAKAPPAVGAQPLYNGEWLQDFAKAKAIAEQRQLPLLLDFTRSDWCGWCVKLKTEVFDKQEFKNYASQNLVLVELDFPRRKTLPDAIKQQNKKQKNKYGIRGFPTIILLDARGNKLGKTGYMRGGPSAFIREIRRITKR